MNKLLKIWLDAPSQSKERYLAMESPYGIETHAKSEHGFDPEFCHDQDFELKDKLKCMAKPFYLEDRSSDEGILCGVEGVDTEDEAVDLFLEPTKYGSWYLYKWDSEQKCWLEASKKRKGKIIELVWKKAD